jgi:NADH dehydrogenase FAD-containing subunit
MDDAERARLMTFVIVGGGPTGVELADMMIETVRKAMPRDFRSIDTRTARVIWPPSHNRTVHSFPASRPPRCKKGGLRPATH